MRPSQLAEHRPQHACVFGDPKTGKSTLVAKLLLAGYRLTWISLDNGHDVVFKLGIPMEQLDEQLNIIVLPDTKDNPVAWRTCMKIITGAKLLVCDRHGEADCSACKLAKDNPTWSTVDPNNFGPKDILVFDHLGQLATSIMTAAFKKAKKPDDEKPEWDQYAVQGNQLDKFLTGVQQARYNIICITHVLEVEMEDGGKKLSPLCGTTNFSRNLGKYFDHLIYCHMKNGTHRFASRSGYQTNLILGSRSDIVIEEMKEPSLVPFFDGTVKGVDRKEEDRKEAKPILSSLAEKAAKLSAPDSPVNEKSDKGEINEVTEQKQPSASEQKPEEQQKVNQSTTQPTTQPQKPSATSAVDRAALLAKLGKMR